MNYCNLCNDGFPSIFRRKVTTINRLLKYIVVMKLIILITALSLQVSAAVYGQQVTINYTNAPLREVMTAVRKQSGYNFLFQSEYLKNAKPVTIHLNNASIEKTLQSIFQDQPFNYKIDGKIISIRPKEKDKSFIEKVKDFFSVITFKGKVTDEDGTPLPGATVRAGNKATLTNNSGEFSLSGVEENADVEVSYIGYAPVTVKASSIYLIISLTRKVGELEEVKINKGYYNTTKELNTGNVSSLKADEIAKQPVGNPLGALQGKIPGLFIQQNSGAPGREYTVLLRGQNSLANGNDPLYIIDGVPFTSTPLSTFIASVGSTSPLNDINPNDIESIDVLKDADATAIYGSRGANGVILITTKKGKSNGTDITLNGYVGAGKVTKKLDLLSTSDYLAMRRQAFANDKASPGKTDYDLNGTYDQNRSTDWQKVLIGGTAKVTDLQGAVSSGSEFTSFRIGLGYRKEGTVYPGDFSNKKASAMFALNHSSINHKFQIGFTGLYVSNVTTLPTTDLTQFIFLAPNSPALYKDNGTLNWANSTWNNPLLEISKPYKETGHNLLSNLNLSYHLVEGLKIEGKFGFNQVEIEQNVLTPYSVLNPITPNPPLRRKNVVADNKINSWIVEPQLSYTANIWRGKLDLLTGATFQQFDQHILSEIASGFANDDLIKTLSAASTVTVNRDSEIKYRYNALYFRAGYSFDDKYILNLTGRRDGSSRFGPGKQFGNFGAIGAAWLFGKEKFVVNNLPFLSFGKLRGSIGVTGNDKLPDYEYLSTYSSYTSGYQGTTGLYPTQLTNPYFAWEVVNKLEGGLDLGFLKDRILFNMSWYRNRTKNQLVGYSLPYTTGFTSIQANFPAVVQNTGVELELNTVNIAGANFKWHTSFNMSFPRNKLISYPDIASSAYATTYAVGYPLQVRFRYHYTGIDPATGLYTFKDQNGDGNYSNEDLVPSFAGQNFYGGFGNTFNYKGWQLDVFFSYAKQKGSNFLFNLQPGLFVKGASNQPSSVLNNATIQPFSQSFGDVFTQNQLFDNSDGRITDASYIRLRNVSLSWQLPGNWQRKAKLKGCKIYLQCENLFTITGYKGLDPENQFNGSVQLPPLRMISAGLQLTL